MPGKLMLYKDFLPSQRKLYQRGGKFQKAASTVEAIIGRFATDEPDPLHGVPLTGHGEERIQHCRKYDLTGFARLVTVHDSGVCLFCYVGAHADVDEWLETNRGLGLAVDGKHQVSDAFASTNIANPSTRVHSHSDLSGGSLYLKLPERYFDHMCEGVPRSLARRLEALESTSPEAEVLALAESAPTLRQQELFVDVFLHLRSGDVRKAKLRVDLYRHELLTLSEVAPDDVGLLVPGEHVAELNPDLFEHFVRTARYQQWMLFLHPEQRSLVDRDFSGPARVTGVSGSGKTCVVIQRAVKLAQKYPGDRVLVLTLNRPLAGLIRDLVDQACPDETRGRIEVRSFWQLCQELLLELEPQNGNLYRDATWRHNEHYSEIWREYYQCENNNTGAAVLWPLHTSLLARGVYPSGYLAQEFDFVRSALAPTERAEYAKMQRSGRAVPFEPEWRSAVLEGLKGWEEKMWFVGVTDYLGLATALYSHLTELLPRYRCVLVDEMQDFGTLELAIIRRLVAPGENDILLCGDVAQRVCFKHHSLGKAGITVTGRTHTITKNYRNSREILEAAYTVLKENSAAGAAPDGDFEILEPEYANFSSPRPLLLSAPTQEEELSYALHYLSMKYPTQDSGRACVAVCGLTTLQVRALAAGVSLPALDGERGIEEGSVFLADLEQTKGFEFDSVCIIGCSEGTLPSPSLPVEEAQRELLRLYVAMTRAKLELIVSYSEEPSRFLRGCESAFVADEWSVHTVGAESLAVRFTELARPDARPLDLGMTGKEFLYAPEAAGVSLALQEKLTDLITGNDRYDSSRQTGWKDIGRALSARDRPTMSRAFGRETYEDFLELFGRSRLTGDQRFLRATRGLPGTLPLAAHRLLEHVRAAFPKGQLRRGRSGRYTEEPATFWSVRIDYLGRTLAVTVFGRPADFTTTGDLVAEGAKHSRFTVKRVEDVEVAATTILAAADVMSQTE